MKLAFCIFNFFPHGGVERDMLRIASACLAHGHEIDVYTMRWRGRIPEKLNVRIVPVFALTNHGRAKAFSKKVHRFIDKENYDLMVGFNKMPALDICFVGDLCFKTKMKQSKNFLCRLLPRYRTYLKLEESVFGLHSNTMIMLLTPKQQEEYHAAYNTSYDRMVILPPGLEYKVPKEAIQASSNVLLFVASQFYNKGLDRGIKALASLNRPEVQLKIIGGDDPKSFLVLANKLKVHQQVKFLGAKDNLFDDMMAASVLIHPARVEAAGMVLLEAIIAGLPVLTTAHCGYAFHIENANAGIVLDEPFSQATCNQALASMLNAEQQIKWQQNALKYAKIADLYHMGEKAVQCIEDVLK